MELRLEHEPYYSDLQREIRNRISLRNSHKISFIENDFRESYLSVVFKRNVFDMSDLQCFEIRLTSMNKADNCTAFCSDLNLINTASKQNRLQTIHGEVSKNSAASLSRPITFKTIKKILHDILNYDISSYFISNPILRHRDCNLPFKMDFSVNRFMDRHVTTNLRDIVEYFTDDHPMNNAFNSYDQKDIQSLKHHALNNTKTLHFRMSKTFPITHDCKDVVRRHWEKCEGQITMYNYNVIKL